MPYYDYRGFTATTQPFLHVLIRYQDVAETNIEWTCATYSFGSLASTAFHGTLWTMYEQVYSKPPF